MSCCSGTLHAVHILVYRAVDIQGILRINTRIHPPFDLRAIFNQNIYPSFNLIIAEQAIKTEHLMIELW